MKRILLPLMLLGIISCNNQHVPYSKIEISTSIKRAYDTIRYKTDTLKTRMFDINFSITNKSKNPISFWLMTCSREDNFIVNNDYIYFHNPGCDSNLPLLYKLNPHDLITWDASVVRYYHTRYPFVKETKFGLIFIDSTRCESIEEYERTIGDRSKHDIIVWSNPIILD